MITALPDDNGTGSPLPETPTTAPQPDADDVSVSTPLPTGPTTVLSTTTEGMCHILCSNGKGGALCDCGDMPPAFEAIPKEKAPSPSPECYQAKEIPCTPTNCDAPRDSLEGFCCSSCTSGWGDEICDCGPPPLASEASHKENVASTPDVFQAINHQNPASGLSNIDPPDCTVLCSTGDGGAACDCHNIPPGIAPIDFRDTDPVNPSPSEPNCTVLCKTGDGGAACGT